MTFLEKAKEEGIEIRRGGTREFAVGCPYEHGFEPCEESQRYCVGHSCTECYAREFTPNNAEYFANFVKLSERKEPDSVAVPKDIARKPRLELVPMNILYDIAKVREYGTMKYGDPENWREVGVTYYLAALLRHVVPMVENINAVDPESGIEHRKHAACNLAFISALLEEK